MPIIRYFENIGMVETKFQIRGYKIGACKSEVFEECCTAEEVYEILKNGAELGVEYYSIIVSNVKIKEK
jgi:hypothetical protein